MVDRAHLVAERAPLCAALAGGEGGHAADHALATRCSLQSQSMPLQAPGPLPTWRRSGLRHRRTGIRAAPNKSRLGRSLAHASNTEQDIRNEQKGEREGKSKELT